MLEKILASRHLRHLDLSDMRNKTMSKLSWDVEHAIGVEIDYKRYLYAMTKKKESEMISPPSRDVDEFWHQHILFTQQYRDDCHLVFGHYLDHNPNLSADAQRSADAKREDLYKEYEIDDLFWDLREEQIKRARRPVHAHGDGGADVMDSGGGDGGHGHGGHCDGRAHGDGGCDASGGDGGGGCGG